MKNKHFFEREDNGKFKVKPAFKSSLIGKELTQAEDENPDWWIRPAKIDGKYQIVTADIRTDRVNVEIEKGIITKVLHVG